MKPQLQVAAKSILTVIIVLVQCEGCGKERNTEAVEHRGAEPTSEKRAVVRLDREEMLRAEIRTERAAKKAVMIPLTLPGKVTFNERKVAQIAARIGGRVEQVSAVTNDHVQTGTALMQLYSQEFLTIQFEFLQAAERLRRAETEGGTARQSEARSLYGAARRKLSVVGLSNQELQNLETSRNPENFYHVRAPFDGVVLESKLKAGEFVQTGNELFEIADLTTLWVLADIYEKDLPFVRTGMKATVQVGAYPIHWVGTLTSIYNVLDEKTHTVKGRIEVQNRAAQLKPGMFCSIQIQTKLGNESIKVPPRAVLGETGKRYVFVGVNDTTFEKRDVLTGTETQEITEILDGIVEGENIVVNGGFFLKSELVKESYSEEQ